jgi:tetratricopeptide (TPR) repeat protein
MATRYVSQGKVKLTALDTTGALNSFTRAVSLERENVGEAEDLLKLTTEGRADIAVLRDYLAANGRSDVVAQIDAATRKFQTPKEALTAGIAYYLAGEYQYARYPLEAALEQDPNYPEALHYLALTYDTYTQLDQTYAAEAEYLRKKRDTLSPRWLGL